MKLGIQSAILEELSLAELVDFAAANQFQCIEVMCWPPGKSERKYAGVSHLDVVDFSPVDAAVVLDLFARKNVEISALGYYPNPLSPDPEEAAICIAHLRAMIDAAALLGVNLVNTFIGNDWTKSVDDNWPTFKRVWGPLLRYAEAKKVRIAIENCAMFFTDDEWPAGKNLAHSPAIWRRMFAEFNSDYFGLNYDPSHMVWMQMNHLKPIDEFMPKFFHTHAKDVSIDRQRLDDVGTLANPLDYHDPRIPGRGDIDWGQYVQALKQAGYDGAFCIEVEDSNYEGSLADRKRALQESGEHLRQYL